jgi:hypothetical protein
LTYLVLPFPTLQMDCHALPQVLGFDMLLSAT